MSANPAAEKFGEEYKAKTGHYPTYIEPQTVFGVRMLAEALKATPPEKGQLNVSKLALNLEKVKIPTPLGDTSIRAVDHQVVLTIVVSNVTQDPNYKADDKALGFKGVTLFTGPVT